MAFDFLLIFLKGLSPKRHIYLNCLLEFLQHRSG